MTSRDGIPDADDLDWRGYEELVKNISAALGREAGVEVVCWGRNCYVEGPPGTRHQIDVLTRHRDDQQQYLTGISCKWTTDKVDLSHVREIAFIVRATDLTKGIIVSKNGYTAPAKRLARSENIGLFELRKPTGEDWGDSITEVRGKVVVDRGPGPDDVRFLRAEPIQDADDERAKERLPMPSLVLIVSPGEEPKSISELAEEARRAHPDQESFEVPLPPGTVIATPLDPGHPADGRAVRGVGFGPQVLPPLTTEIHVRAEDVIYMIMCDVFTDQQHNITTDGQIIATQ